MKRIMIRNSKKIKRPANPRYLCTLTQRQLRAAMAIPVMYEHLKREKLRLHKARYVLASWGRNRTKELKADAKEPSGNQPFIILSDALVSHSVLQTFGFLSLLHQNPVVSTYTYHCPMETMKPKLLQLPLCCLRLFRWSRWSQEMYVASLVACQVISGREAPNVGCGEWEA